MKKQTTLLLLMASLSLTIVSCEKEEDTQPTYTENNDEGEKTDNENGIENGDEDNRGILFNPDITYREVSDADNNKYKTVIIGNQEWMAENLAYEVSNGNYWAYDNNNSNIETYGYLYDWQTAVNACPDGWHLPSEADWEELFDYLDGKNVAGGKLKETSTTHWVTPNEGATNETGFTALPGGARNDSGGSWLMIGYGGGWWSSTEIQTNARYYTLNYYYNDVSSLSGNKNLGLSVRCVKN